MTQDTDLLRKMVCPYCDFETLSDPTYSTFEALPDMPRDKFWDGCVEGMGN